MLLFDFEYRDNEQASKIVCLSHRDTISGEEGVIDLRDGVGRDELDTLYLSNLDSTWVAFNARADLSCLYSMGYPIRNLRVIDAMAESSMIRLSHPDFRPKKKRDDEKREKDEIGMGLLPSLYRFGLIGGKEFATLRIEKDQARKLILGSETYTDSEFATIYDYGLDDVRYLDGLIQTCMNVHEAVGTGLTVDQMVKRGEYVVAVTELYLRSKGFPINMERMTAIDDNREEIIAQLSQDANDKYCEVHEPALYKFEGSPKHWVAKVDGLEYLIVEKYGISDWKRTDCGRLSMQGDYLEKQIASRPHLKDLYRTRKTILAMSGKPIGDMESGGYIRPEPFTLGQVTGRNSPKPTKGFILNMTPWLRSALVHPKKGMVMIGFDWQQQEIGIAAALSGDDNLKRVYLSTDPYLELAKMAGAVPEDATKESHSAERQQYKAVQLGLGYGKGVLALAADIRDSSWVEGTGFTMSVSDASRRAVTIKKWHEKQFKVYWRWVETNVKQARRRKFISSVDGWTRFGANRAAVNELKNYPMQSNAAAMLRAMVIGLAPYGIDMICTLHDAVYVQGKLEDTEKLVEIVNKVMNEASVEILGDDFILGIDAPDIYSNEKPYWDNRGAEQYKSINSLLLGVLTH